jgi:hypothetical protein
LSLLRFDERFIVGMGRRVRHAVQRRSQARVGINHIGMPMNEFAVGNLPGFLILRRHLSTLFPRTIVQARENSEIPRWPI